MPFFVKNSLCFSCEQSVRYVLCTMHAFKLTTVDLFDWTDWNGNHFLFSQVKWQTLLQDNHKEI